MRLLPLLLVFATADAMGQQNANPPEDRGPPFDQTIVVNGRLLARSRLESAKPDRMAEIRRDKLEAARNLFHARRLEYLAGRGNLEFFMLSALRLLDAERAVSVEESDSRAALERHWTRLRDVESVNNARWESGRIPIREFLRPKYYRLDAEIELAEVRSKNRDPHAGTVATAHLVTAGAISPKAFARARFEASQSEVTALRQEQQAVALEGHVSGMKEMLAGRSTPDLCLVWSLRLLKADNALSKSPEDRYAAVARHWLAAREFEALFRYRYLQGRVPVQDLDQTHEWRLEAEIWLTEARAKLGIARPHARDEVLEELVDEPFNSQFKHFARTLARLRFEATESDVRQLTRARLEPLRSAYEAREREFICGRGTLEFDIEAARRYVRAEFALAEREASRRDVLERHWRRLYQIDMTVNARYEAGRIPVQDRELARYCRLEAEEWLLLGRVIPGQ
jgi:hypothetical protein